MPLVARNGKKRTTQQIGSAQIDPAFPELDVPGAIQSMVLRMLHRFRCRNILACNIARRMLAHERVLQAKDRPNDSMPRLRATFTAFEPPQKWPLV